jgi:cell division protein FtsB
MASKKPLIERIAVRLPPEKAVGRWARNLRLSGFAITALGLIILCLVVLAPSLKIYIDQRQKIASIEAQNAQAKATITDLKSQKAQWDDPAYIEAQARSRLDYVFPGDFSYLVKDDGATAAVTTADGAPISTKIQTTQVDWVSTLLSSVFTAGLTDAPANKIVAPVISDKQR